jgi:hypothetical protein
LLPWIHFAFPLVVDTCVLQPPIATLSETASSLQVFPKGLVVRACGCTVRVESWVCPYANKGFRKGNEDNNIYIKLHQDSILIIEVYVDDIIFGSHDERKSQKFSKDMQNEF